MYRPILEHLSTGRVSVECRPMYKPIYRLISTNTPSVKVKCRWSIGAVSVKYRRNIGEVSVSHEVYRPIGVSVDTSVDTRPIYWPILDHLPYFELTCDHFRAGIIYGMNLAIISGPSLGSFAYCTENDPSTPRHKIWKFEDSGFEQ